MLVPCVRATLLCGHHHRFSLQYIHVPVIIVLSIDSATCLPGKNINKYIYHHLVVYMTTYVHTEYIYINRVHIFFITYHLIKI